MSALQLPRDLADLAIADPAAERARLGVSSIRPPQLVVDPAGLGDYLDLPTALAAVPAGGATVLVKRGTYTLTATLTLPAKTTLRGEGMLATIIQAPLSNANALTVAGADVAIEDLQIDGRYASQTNNGAQSVQCGVDLASGAHRCRIQRVYIRDTCGMGVCNVQHCDDLTVEGCRITNGGVAASQVQAAPAPTTTTFAVSPGMSSNFVAAQVLRIGTQTGTVLSVQSVKSYVAVATSTTVFTLNAGDGTLFANGQVIRVGPYSGTISTVVGDVVTLTAPVALIPVIGQIVAIDNITLAGAITTPTAGNIVGVAGAYQAGIYVALSAQRPVIRNNYISGWSQGLGLWYGTAYGLVEGNRLVANYGYADTAHTIPRSALEVYPNNNFGGYHRVLGNLIDGSTHNCIECAQGEVGTVFQGNTLRGWASDSGLGTGSGAGMEVTGQAGVPGGTQDIRIVGNTWVSLGATVSIGLILNTFSSRVAVSANAFLNFSGDLNSYPVTVGGGDAPVITGNTFAYSYRAVFVNATGTPGGVITANAAWGVPINGYAFDLSGAGNGWVLAHNSVDGNASLGGTGIRIISGAGHRMLGNRLKIYQPVTIAANDCRVEENYCEGTTDGNEGLIATSNALRTLIARNIVKDNGNRYCIVLGGSSDYTQVYDNRLDSTANPGSFGGIAPLKDDSSGTHNGIALGDNHLSSVTRPASLKALGAQTVNIAQVTIAHGLGYIPSQVLIAPTSNNTIWKSAASDSTNVYLKANADGATGEVYVR